MLRCKEYAEFLHIWRTCSEVDDGVVISTDCLYPSFEQVKVHIAKNGRGFTVSDLSGALFATISSGGDESSFRKASIDNLEKFRVKMFDGSLICEVPSAEWVGAAILSVSNASASVARQALLIEEKDYRAYASGMLESELDAARQEVINLRQEFNVRKDFHAPGASGKKWRVDYAVLAEKPILIKSVSPHGNSINANFVAFSDISKRDGYRNFSVYTRSLDDDDVRLLNQVANVIPVSELHRRVARELRSAP